MIAECYKETWKNRCCCNCVHRVTLVKHPWNEGEAKGSIEELFGYACTHPELESAVFFNSSRQHGLCELHDRKN